MDSVPARYLKQLIMDAQQTFVATLGLTGMGDMPWGCVTLVLSVAVIVGYAVIAFNWYFQAKLRRTADSKAALTQLRGIFVCCVLCGFLFVVMKTNWYVWRLYDVVLLVIAVRAWTFIHRMRGMSLVDERLAQVTELEESAQKYRNIAELLPHMVWMASADGDVDFSNRQWCSYAGDGRTWLDAVHPDERHAVRAWWRDAVAAQQPVSREVRLGGRGQYRTFIINAAPIVQGNAAKWLGACADIEDQKVLAAEKETRARRHAFFLNALSHDLRAPLNNISLNAHVLKMSAVDPVEVESINMIQEGALAAGELLTRLLDFARVGAHEQNEIAEVFPAAVLQQAMRRFAPIAAQKGLQLRADGGDAALAADIAILTDRHKLERVINNLIDNAIKYTSNGGVFVGLEVRDGGILSIRIRDTGVGIPPESVPHLFDEFYQVNNHARDPVQGFGIGLAICRCLARQLGGDVRLDSSGPHGSCFEFILKGVRLGRRGRRGGAEGDLADPPEARLCRI